MKTAQGEVRRGGRNPGNARPEYLCVPEGRCETQLRVRTNQIAVHRLKCSLPHEPRTSNTGTNVRPYAVSEYRTRSGNPCSW